MIAVFAELPMPLPLSLALALVLLLTLPMVLELELVLALALAVSWAMRAKVAALWAPTVVIAAAGAVDRAASLCCEGDTVRVGDGVEVQPSHEGVDGGVL